MTELVADAEGFFPAGTHPEVPMLCEVGVGFFFQFWTGEHWGRCDPSPKEANNRTSRRCPSLEQRPRWKPLPGSEPKPLVVARVHDSVVMAVTHKADPVERKRPPLDWAREAAKPFDPFKGFEMEIDSGGYDYGPPKGKTQGGLGQSPDLKEAKPWVDPSFQAGWGKK